MPWQEATTVSLREEFVLLAGAAGANMRALCRRFGISPTTGYKLLRRWRAEGAAGLADRSRRPRASPRQTAPAIEAAILALRAAHPAWGPRKLRQGLVDSGATPPLPAASTIAAILRRNGCIDPAAAPTHTPWRRFARAAPNELWQMDFKGHLPLADGTRCHPLTVLDDHSRFCLALVACADERGATVQAALVAVFARYGLPDRMLVDNGAPWGADPAHPWTPLTVWLLRLGVVTSHGRPHHPQTQGKAERFHRTLAAEALGPRPFADLAAAQAAFDRFRHTYNLVRPHEALDLAVPAARFSLSPRLPPTELPAPSYGPDDTVRTVQQHGELHLGGWIYRVPHAFAGHRVAVRATRDAAIRAVCFGSVQIATLDLDRPHRKG
jgi:transposase InsO family protein